MFIVLLENRANVILSDLDFFKSRYAKSSIFEINSKTSLQDLGILQTKPLLNVNWLVVMQSGAIKRSHLIFLSKLEESILVVLRVNTEEDSNKLITFLKTEKINFRFINNYKMSKEKVINFIVKSLKVSESLAEHLYQRVNGYLPEIVLGVQTLKAVDDITIRKIDRYVEKRHTIPIYDLVNYLLGVNERVTYEECLSLVYEYRFGFQYLLKSVIQQLELLREVFLVTLAGEITIQNYKVKKSELSNPDLAKMHDYRFFKMLELFDCVSYDYLELLIASVNKVPKNFDRGIWDFISILRWNSKNRSWGQEQVLGARKN